jgi:hypothetical protein
MQLLAVNDVVNNVKLSEFSKDRVHFVWGGNMWQQIWLPLWECNPDDIELRKGMVGKLVQYQGKYYKTYKFIPE